MAVQKKQKAILKVEPPRLEAQQSLANLEGVEFFDEAEYSRIKIASAVFAGVSAQFVILDKCQIERARFNGASLKKLRLADCKLSACDLSNLDLSKCTANRNEFIDSKLTGLIAREAYFANVRFDKCIIDNAQFLDSEFKKVIFSECKLSGTDFQHCDLQEAKFENCDLTGCNFDEAKLSGCDFRGSDLKGVKVRPQDLKGAIINHDQALALGQYFASLLGIEVLEF